jgi:hypothetical protein
MPNKVKQSLLSLTSVNKKVLEHRRSQNRTGQVSNLRPLLLLRYPRHRRAERDNTL